MGRALLEETMGSPNLSQLAIILSIFSIALQVLFITMLIIVDRQKKNKALQSSSSKFGSKRNSKQNMPSRTLANEPQSRPPYSEHRADAIEMGNIKEQLQGLNEKVKINSEIIEQLRNTIKTLQANQQAIREAPAPIADTISRFLVNQSGSNQTISSYSPVSDPNSASWTRVPESTDLGSFPPVVVAAAMQPKEPYEEITQRYQDAVDREDRPALRQMQFKELNINGRISTTIGHSNVKANIIKILSINYHIRSLIRE
jgi:cytoskeletal protein RodZ